MELTHAGPKCAAREAEQNAQTGVVCSDMVGVSFHLERNIPTAVARIPKTTKEANTINVPRTPRCQPLKASHRQAVSLYGELVISSIIPTHKQTNGNDEPISENGPAGRKPKCSTINQRTPKQIQPTIPYTILFSAVFRNGVIFRYSNAQAQARRGNGPLSARRVSPASTGALGWAGKSFSSGSVICREFRYPSSDNLVCSGEFLNHDDQFFPPFIRADIGVKRVVPGYRMRKQLYRSLLIA